MKYVLIPIVGMLVVMGAAQALNVVAPSYSWGENVGWFNWSTTEGDVDITDGVSMDGYVWGENVGWISLTCENTSSCCPGVGCVDYGITASGADEWVGYAWGENIGWLSFSCDNTSSCGTAEYAVRSSGSAELVGYAYGENIGWVNMNCDNDASCGTVDFGVHATPTPTATATPTPPSGGSSGSYISPPVTPPFSPPPGVPPVTPGISPVVPPVTPPAKPPPFTPPGPPPTTPPTITPGPISETAETISDALDRISSIVFGSVCDGTATGFLACTTTALGVAAVLMALFAAIMQNELLAIGFSLLQIMGLKRRAKVWGVVYDSKTKHPIPLAKVELLDANGRVLETRFTDRDGRYGFLTSPTSLQQSEIVVTMRATKPGYTFPSSLAIIGTDFVVYDHIYRGAAVHLRTDSLLNFNIPVDPVSDTRAAWSGMGRGLVGTLGDRILHLGFLLGLFVVPLNLWLMPSVKNLVILILFFGVNLIRMFALYRPYGLTVDALTGTPLPFALVTLMDMSGTRVSFAVSDEFGRYILSGHRGVDYEIIAYTPANTQPQRIIREPLNDIRRSGWVTRKLSI